MTADLTNLLWRIISLTWLTGPIFEKELRVCSRRKRNYVLRSAYLLLLTVLIASAWLRIMLLGSGTSIAYRISRMGELGKNLILTITWFQFIAAQLVAVVMLSNSVSDEIRRGTLDVLMTTPINSLQIVAGKLFSSLLQLTLLLAISLPLLAIVRVLGGMHWDYLVASLSITFTAVLFTGSLTMLLSVRLRRPYMVILIMLILLVLAYSLASILTVLLGSAKHTVTEALVLANPAAAMLRVTYLTFPGRGFGGASFSWSLHCLIMISASTVVLLASALMIRRSTLARLRRTEDKMAVRALKRMVGLTGSGKAPAATAAIRPVKGPVIIWKELGRPISESVRSHTIVFLVLSVALILMCCLSRGAIMVYSILTTGLWMIASVRTAAMAATTIAKEKEARTWPLLLGTTLDDRQIIRGKALAVLWRNLPLWLAIAVGMVAFFTFMVLFGRARGPGGSFFYCFYILGGLITVGTHIVFLVAIGLYFSVRLKSATAAVIATVGSVLGLFIAYRFLLPLIFGALMMVIAGRAFVGKYGGIILFYVVPSAVRLGIGLLLIQRAERQLRGNIF